MFTMQIQNACLSFADRKILNDVSFTIDQKTRAALAGANGCGKSTLLKVITGIIPADGINISKTKGITVSYLPQADILLPQKSVYEVAEEGYDKYKALVNEYEEIAKELDGIGQQDKYSHILSRMNEINEILDDVGYYHRRSRIEQILQGLGFKMSDLSSPSSTFSGGWQMRIALARILVEDPDILLLDEPTNYLDIEAMVWLKNYLKAFDGGVILVSHDQGFLDDTVDCVYELFKGNLTRYSGNYTSYLKQREAEIQMLEKAYEQQAAEIEKTQEFIERFRYKATKAKQVQSRIKSLEKTELIEIPDHLKKLSFSFPEAPHSGNDVLVIEKLFKAYGSNVIFEDLSFVVRKKERLAITGRNGEGKSTLLRILAGVDEDFKGVVRDGAGVKKGYFAQDNEKTLNDNNTVLEEVESIADTKDIPRLRSLLGAFLFNGDDVFKKVSVLSGGEKSRLSLLKILLHPCNLLLLDEPTNHLDINAKEMLLEAIKAYDGTVIFVSHDTHFIKNLATKILYLSDDKPEFFEGDYDYFAYKLEEKENKFLQSEKKKSDVIENKSQSHQEQKAKRNMIQKLEKECDDLLLSCDKLKNEIKALEERMADPAIYSNAAKISELVKQKEEKEKALESLEEKWFEASERLENSKAELL
ncbi:ABC-F family ATP-binding cassette domain-containing protein [Bullifex porci]|uniref:ABC-F family ATP-binding cassette domain-containing protein n=2 Tax=Bullifex porci TaxID=2606638 RepID=UPI0023EFE1C1|nr:ABC-F family ATP-binding cassette domain-containing protein [Bullifex porci]MDY2741978.1 ABC-F family ATP-binding cassette domain-containing protein [Bullifex porci]